MLDVGNTSITDLWIGNDGETVKLLKEGKVVVSDEVQALRVTANTEIVSANFRIDLLTTLS